MWLTVALLAVLAAIGAFQAVEDGPSEAREDATTTSTTAGSGPAPDDSQGGTATEAQPPVDPTAPLLPEGTGPLVVGRTLRDLEAGGLTLVVDQPTFRGTGGTCFDARVADVGDLVLRFRSPVPDEVITEPGDGVLGALVIDARRGSFRTTEAGVGLGSTVDELRKAYGEALDETRHPFLPSGQLLTYLPDEDAANGLAFTTDGGAVTSVAAGAVDLITSPESCS